MSERISVVGLGRMGNAIAERLAKQGHSVPGCSKVLGQRWMTSFKFRNDPDVAALISRAYDEA